MQSVLVALVGGLGLALSLVAPSDASKPSDTARRSAEVQACLRGCDAQASSTDRSTCRLQCEEGVQSKREPDVVRWKKTEYYDGLPDGAQKGGTVTTTTERSPLGTTTTTTSTTANQQGTPTSGAAASAAKPPSVSPYAVLAQCQALCDVERSPTNRATCKLQCLNNPRHRTPGTATTATTSSVEAQCRARCEASEATPGARATCTHNCVATEKTRARPQTPPSPKPAARKPATAPRASTKAKAGKPKADAAKARACRSDCHRRASACSENCTGEGSNKSTCELQCSQTATRCAERCG